MTAAKRRPFGLNLKSKRIFLKVRIFFLPLNGLDLALRISPSAHLVIEEGTLGLDLGSLQSLVTVNNFLLRRTEICMTKSVMMTTTFGLLFKVAQQR